MFSIKQNIPGCMTYVVHPVIIVNLQLAEEAARVSIDNIQKAVVICLIIPTIFPFDAGSSIKIPGCMTYVVHPGF
jgi:hypothetical protein